jgi:hypothetical protein
MERMKSGECVRAGSTNVRIEKKFFTFFMHFILCDASDVSSSSILLDRLKKSTEC